MVKYVSFVKTPQSIHYVYYHGCEVVQDYNKSQSVNCICFMENNLP